MKKHYKWNLNEWKATYKYARMYTHIDPHHKHITACLLQCKDANIQTHSALLNVGKKKCLHAQTQATLLALQLPSTCGEDSPIGGHPSPRFSSQYTPISVPPVSP